MKLFDVIAGGKELDRHFVTCRNNKYMVEVLEEWADDGLIYRDGSNQFVKEFQTAFDSALWKLYCSQVLKKLGCKMDLIHEAPLLMECAVANTAAEHNALSGLNQDADEMVYEQIISLSDAFYSKHRKYSDSYSKKEWATNKPYIIAIAPLERLS